ncbi:hypothetical protein [Paenibacillus sp. sgz302251]|uniref:hypothetical protein n=1 Tax=Paenibacillus sp. sgz302251 TaxID=3414493 RepID=UPI003C7A6BA6
MIDPNKDFPLYYDGSAHVEFSDELTDKMRTNTNEKLNNNNQEWQRFIGTNLFGMDTK